MNSAALWNAVKDICSRIRQNLDFFELDPNSGEFGYVDHLVFSSVQNTSPRCASGPPWQVENMILTAVRHS